MASPCLFCQMVGLFVVLCPFCVSCKMMDEGRLTVVLVVVSLRQHNQRGCRPGLLEAQVM